MKGCQACPASTYSDDEGAIVCKQCPEGSFTSTIGSDTGALCIPCPRGTYYYASQNHTLQEEARCHPCERGKYSDVEGTVGSCLSCPVGKSCRVLCQSSWAHAVTYL
jgi:hypothetical protein